MPSIAYFVSAHGFGHAARACAILAALHQRQPGLIVHLFTTAPEWFFRDSMGGGFVYHSTSIDIGLAQTSALQADLAETVRQLDAFLPFDIQQIETLAHQVHGLGCECVVCDIAPLGIAVAKEAGLPSVLIENFTWDWIYAGYSADEPRLAHHLEYLQRWFAVADHHLQAEPICAPNPRALPIAPVSRMPRASRDHVRAELQVPMDAPLVLITMGGIQERYQFLTQLPQFAPVHFVIPGGSDFVEFRDNLRLLPHHSPLYHPDLVHASDVVIGKLGYSTLAEALHARAPFGFIARAGFRESPPLTEYVVSRQLGFEIAADDFFSGAFTFLPRLLAWPRPESVLPNGAEQAAEFLVSR